MPLARSELAPGSGGGEAGSGLNPLQTLHTSGACFQRVWLEPALLSALPFTSEKDLLSLTWLADWCQFSPRQPGNPRLPGKQNCGGFLRLQLGKGVQVGLVDRAGDPESHLKSSSQKGQVRWHLPMCLVP